MGEKTLKNLMAFKINPEIELNCYFHKVVENAEPARFLAEIIETRIE